MTGYSSTTLAIIAVILGACSASVAAPGGDTIEGKARAIDGDTVSIDFRVFGADALERKQWCQTGDGCVPCGKAAQDFAAKFLSRGLAEIRMIGPQSYGRPVAVVTVGTADLGEAMIRAGYAVPRPNFMASDPGRAERYTAAFRDALKAKAGAFAGQWIDPADWRKGARLQCEQARREARGQGQGDYPARW